MGGLGFAAPATSPSEGLGSKCVDESLQRLFFTQKSAEDWMFFFFFFFVERPTQYSTKEVRE